MLSYPYFCLCMTLCCCIKQLQLQLFTSDDQTLPSATIVLGMRKILTFLVIAYTGRERLIRSHSSARFCFELSGNSN